MYNIFVEVDRLTKFVRFVTIPTDYNTVQVTKLFFIETFRLHELPQSRLSDRDSRFISTSEELPPLDEEGQLQLVLEEVLEFRERRLRSRVNRECLVRWRELPVEDATWEREKILQHPQLVLLEEKKSQEGRTVMSLSK
jgi:hypothetical protein